MKKFKVAIVSGNQGAGKSTFIKKLTEGEKTAILHCPETWEEFKSKINELMHPAVETSIVVFTEVSNHRNLDYIGTFIRHDVWQYRYPHVIIETKLPIEELQGVILQAKQNPNVEHILTINIQKLS
jgi:GTPase SAR1 family protein